MRIHAVCADRGIAIDGSKGASVHLRSILGALVAEGAEVTLFCRRLPAAPPDLPFPVRPLEQLDRALDSERPDLVYERYSLGHRRAMDLARVRGLNFALEVNAALAEEAARHRPDTTSADDREIETDLWRGADLVFPVSRALAERIRARRNRPDGIELIANGIAPELFADLPVRRPDPAARFRLGFLGHPRPWHGTGLLATVVDLLLQRGIDPQIVIVGGGPGADALRRDFADRGLDDHLEISGALPQRAAIETLSGCDLALAPYEDLEDFYFCPLKVLESLATGLALVSHPLGDIEELAGPGAVLVPAGSAEAIAEAVASLHGDPERRERLAEAGRAHVISRFSWRQQAARIIAATETRLPGGVRR